MQKLHVLRAFVEQRLSDVTDDIFRRFAATIVEYELEVQRLKLELEAAGAPGAGPGAGPEGGPEGGPEETPSGVLHVFTEEEKQQARGRGFSLHIKEEEGGASGPEDIDITSSPFPEAELHPADSQQEVLGVKQEVEDDHMMLEAAVRAEVISQQDGVLQIFTREEEQQVKGRSLSLQIKQEEGGASGSETSPESLMESDDDEGSSSSNQIQTFEEAKLLSSDLLRPEPGGTCRSPGSRTGPPDQNLLACNSCGREFSSRRILQKHIRQNSAQNQNQNQMSCSLRRQRTTNYCSCRVCGSSFNTQGILVRHAQNHCKEPETRCGACGDVLESTECLREHLQSHKDAGSTCDVCGKKWSSIRRMEIHKRVHTGEKPYHCSLCSLDFSRKESLVRHLRMHSGDRPHHCGLCRRTFTRREYLVQHLRMVHIDTPEPAPEN